MKFDRLATNPFQRSVFLGCGWNRIAYRCRYYFIDY